MRLPIAQPLALAVLLAACAWEERSIFDEGPAPAPRAPAAEAPRPAPPAGPVPDDEVVGRSVGDLDAIDWLQGRTTLADGRATLVVFWELWCPHCRTHLPQVEPLYQSLNGRGLNVVAVTRLTRNVSRDEALAFVKEHNLSFPVAVAGERLAGELSIRGIPAAAVIRDGRVVWRGHPSRLDEATLDGFVSRL